MKVSIAKLHFLKNKQGHFLSSSGNAKQKQHPHCVCDLTSIAAIIIKQIILKPFFIALFGVQSKSQYKSPSFFKKKT